MATATATPRMRAPRRERDLRSPPGPPRVFARRAHLRCRRIAAACGGSAPARVALVPGAASRRERYAAPRGRHRLRPRQRGGADAATLATRARTRAGPGIADAAVVAGETGMASVATQRAARVRRC